MTEPTRVLLWTSSFWPTIGGADVMAARLGRGLSEQGFEVLVVTGRSDASLPAEDSYAGIRVHRFDFWDALGSRNPERFLDIRRGVAGLTQAFRPDLIHVTFLSPDAIFLLETLRGSDLPVLVTVQQAAVQDWGIRRDTILGRLLGRAGRLAYCSLAMRREIEASLPELEPRGSVIPNALDVPPGSPAPLPGAPRLLCLGRLVPEKGFDVALRAFVPVAARWPAARLTIAGDGPERAALEALAGDLELRDRVEFTGWVSPGQVPALINRSSLLLAPSRKEAFGLVALEAMVLGRAVVASDAGGLPEVVSHERTGLVVPREDVPATTAAVLRLLERPVELAGLGSAGRALAADRFAWSHHVARYRDLYHRIAPARARAHV